MSNPSGLTEDLEYLRSKYNLGSTLVSSLTTSPQVARTYIRLLKARLVTTSVLPALLGIVLLGLGLYWRGVWFGMVLGILGILGAGYFAASFLRQKNAISEIEKIASYHSLI